MANGTSRRQFLQTLSGAAAGNYTLASTTATTTANITAVTLTPTVTAANKVYDGTTAATASCAGSRFRSPVPTRW